MKPLLPTIEAAQIHRQLSPPSVRKSVVRQPALSLTQALLIGAMLLVCGAVQASDAEDVESSRYKHQEDSGQTVLLFGDTGIVTAKLWAKGVSTKRLNL